MGGNQSADSRKLEAQKYYEARLEGGKRTGRNSSIASVEPPIFAVHAANVRVIGIGGCTRSGKSVLTQQVQDALTSAGHEVACVCLDEFFGPLPFAMVDLSSGRSFPDLESPCSLRWLDFAKAVDTAVSHIADKHGGIVIIDGFLLYYHTSVQERCDSALYIELTKDECKARRMQTKAVPEDYFEEMLWPSFQKYGQAPRGAALLDGSMLQETLRSRAIEILQVSVNIPNLHSHVDSFTDIRVATATAGVCLPMPVGMVQRLLRSVSTSFEPPVVLVLSGAFNPPHRMHIDCLLAAREHLERNHGLEVVFGYIAPTNDRYIMSKAQEAAEYPHLAMPILERCRLCELACQDVSCTEWVRVLPWGIASGSSVKRSVERALCKFGVRVRCITVYGADFYLRSEGLPEWSVCVSRAGYDDDLQTLLKNVVEVQGGLPEGFFATSAPLEVASSTEVRAFWKRQDWQGLQHSALLHPSVLEDMIANHTRLDTVPADDVQ